MSAVVEVSAVEFIERCLSLAHRHGRKTESWSGRYCVMTYAYEDAALSILTTSARFEIRGKAVRRGEKEELLLGLGADDARLIGYGDLYTHWLSGLDAALEGQASTQPINLENLGSLAPLFQQLQTN